MVGLAGGVPNTVEGVHVSSTHLSIHFIRLIALGLLLSSYSLNAGPLDDGLAAFNAADYARAFELWKPLAEAGDAKAQYNIGLLYMNGLGVEPNGVYARELFRAAARQGLVDAQYNLGLIFYEGISTFRRPNEAYQWWSMSAAQGHAPSQYNLGVLYLQGSGTGQSSDPAKTLKFWEAAAAQGYPEAIESLIRVYGSGELTGQPQPERAEYWRQRQ